MVNVWRVRILVHSKSWSFSSASRQTRRNEAAERALPRNSRFLFKVLSASSSSGVMESVEESSFISNSILVRLISYSWQ